MTRFVSKDWKPLEQIIKERKIKELTLSLLEVSEKYIVYKLDGDGKEIHTTSSSFPLPQEMLRLKLEQKKGFPLELDSLQINLGIVKANLKPKK